MSQLKADVPPAPKTGAYDPSPNRHPNLTLQGFWAQKHVLEQRHLQRTLFLGYTNFKIMSRDRKGQAELIRLLLTFAGIPFDDVIVSDVDWKCLMCKVPYGNLPVLWLDHNVYGEPNAICRLLARHLGLMGLSETETLVAEAVFLQVKRLEESEVMQKAFEELQVLPDDNVETVFQELLPDNLGSWDRQIQASPGPFVLPSGISVADLAIYDFLSQYRTYLPLDPVLSQYKNVQELCTAVAHHPSLAVYLAQPEHATSHL